MNLNYLGILTILIYISIALAQGITLFGIMPCSRWRYFTCSLLSITGHGWILYKLIEIPQGQNLHVLLMLSFTLWLMNIFTLIASLRSKVENLCILTHPLAALSIGLSLTFSGMHVMDTPPAPSVLAHIFISLFAMSLLMLASLQAILVGLQNSLLKSQHPSPMLRFLPPLQTMETLLFYIIWTGVIFLTGSLITGFFFKVGLLSTSLYPKTLLAVGAWILLVLLLIGRYFFGWRGPTAIRWTLSGTVFAFLSYFGTKAFL